MKKLYFLLYLNQQQKENFLLFLKTTLELLLEIFIYIFLALIIGALLNISDITEKLHLFQKQIENKEIYFLFMHLFVHLWEGMIGELIMFIITLFIGFPVYWLIKNKISSTEYALQEEIERNKLEQQIIKVKK